MAKLKHVYLTFFKKKQQEVDCKREREQCILSPCEVLFRKFCIGTGTQLQAGFKPMWCFLLHGGLNQ